MDTLEGKRPFLVIRGYGHWHTVAVIWARTGSEIENTFSFLEVLDAPPDWVDDSMLEEMTSRHHDIDNLDAWIRAFTDAEPPSLGMIRVDGES